MVPNFTGRKSECDEIAGLLASQSTRIMSIWGPPGFGKTSVAIAVGHVLQSQGLPVYFISLRGLHSKADLTLKLLHFVRQFAAHDEPSDQYLAPDDELCQFFLEIADRCVLILDDADDLLESGSSEEEDEIIGLLKKILTQNKKVTFAVTTRECFINSHFQGHRSVRIGPLGETSSLSLVRELLPNASTSDCEEIAQICGHVPLAIRLLCSLISKDSSQPRQLLDDFMGSFTESIPELLGSLDYPTDHQMQFAFWTSFLSLSAQEKDALVSLCILPDNFHGEVAAAVMGKTKISEAKTILQSLRRRSFLDSSSNPGSFSMPKLLQAFVRKTGERQMKEILIESRARFHHFYVSLFERLNEQFLTGHSMAAFTAFYQHKHSILQSLIEGCSSPRTTKSVLDVLVKAELFLDSLFWISNEADNFDKVYDSALKAAKVLEEHVLYRRLLTSRAFSEIAWGVNGNTQQLLSEVNEIQAASSPASLDEKGKYLCYLGIYQLVTKETESGVGCLQEALSLMNNTPEQTILKLIILQILCVYYQSTNNSSSATHIYYKAFEECRTAKETQLLLITPTESTATKNAVKTSPQRKSGTLLNQPLELQVVFHVNEASKHFSHIGTSNCLRKVLLKILADIETALPNSAPGLLNFRCMVLNMLSHFTGSSDGDVDFSEANTGDLPKEPEHCKSGSKISAQSNEMHKDALAKSYLDVGEDQYNKGNLSEALQSFQSAVHLTLKLFGEEHPRTAESYYLLGTTQHALGDFSSAVESKRRALSIALRQSGEEPDSSTADCFYSLGSTQLALGDFTAALHSTQCALKIRTQLFGEEHPSTAESYFALGITQHAVGDLTSALQSTQRALDIRRKLFGEEHPSTADSYNSLGAIQHALGELNSAVYSKQRAVEIRLELFGEDHPSTAESYNSLGVTQHSQGDFRSALRSKQLALEIRLALFGQEHSSVAESYYSLGGTQYKLGDYTVALRSKQCSLNIRQKIVGENHSSTAYSYYSLGATQHALGDFTSALLSKQRSADIRLKLFGEDHLSTADSFYSLGVTQHELGDFAASLQSLKRAISIRLRLFEKELSNTTA